MSAPTRTASERDLEQLAKQGGLNLAGSLVSAAIGLLVPVLVTRSFDRAEAGVFFQATAMFMVLIGVGVLGSDTGLLRFLPAAVARRSIDDVRRTVRLAVGPPIAFTVVVSVVILLTAGPLGRLLGPEEELAEQFADLLVVLAIAAPVAVLHVLGLAVSRGLGSVFGLVVIEKLGRGVAQLACTAGAVAVSSSLLVLVVAWVAPYAAALVVLCAWLVRRVAALVARVAGDEGPATAGLGRDYWGFTAPRAVSRVLVVVLQRIDIVLVGVWRGPADAALYAAATRFPVLGLMFVQAIQQVMSPKISQLLTLGERARAVVLFRTTTAWLVLVSWPIYLVCLAFASLLLDVFGGGYDAALPAVVVLCSVMLLATACGPVDAVLLMGGRSGLSLLNTALALVTMLLVDWWLVPEHGATGAAIGWAAAIAVNNLLPLWQVHRTMGMHPVGASTAHAVGLTLAAGVVALACRGVAGASVWSLLGAVVLGGLVMAAGAWRFRAPLELDALVAAVRRRR